MKRPFFDLEVGGKTYSFKLTAKAIAGIESKLNESFALTITQNPAPPVSLIAVIMESAAKENHPDFSAQDACDLIDTFLDEDENGYKELSVIYKKIVDTSGFFSRKTSTTETAESQKAE